jgi:ATP/maltotriose-dependent transcriptional regulator MalT
VQARDALARRRVDEARLIQEELAADEAVRRLPLALVAQWMLAGLIESAEGRYAAAEGSLRHAATIARRVRATRVFCDPQLALAQLYLRWGRETEALQALEPALQRWEHAEMPGAVLREGPGIGPVLQFAVQRDVQAPFATRLLGMLQPTPRTESVTVPQTGATLSPREVEVLRLIAAGATNKDVAARLVISERTVKTHLYNLFRKLDVASRTQAAARARELNLA